MTRDPFHPVASGAGFLETAPAANALHCLASGMGAREPFLLLTGESGVGKTALVNAALERWKDLVTAAFLPAPGLSGADLVEEILLRFGEQPAAGASRPRLVACFEQVTANVIASQRIPLIVLDDADGVATEALEELRLLVNAALQAQRPVEVLLVGTSVLEARLDDPALAAVRDRLSVRARLEPLSVSETRRFVKHRIDAAGHGEHPFPRKTCAELASASGGIPRRINALASQSLRIARDAGEPTVQVSHVRAAAALLGAGATSRAREPESGHATDQKNGATPASSGSPLAAPEVSVVPESPAERPASTEVASAAARPRPEPTASACVQRNPLLEEYEAEAEAHRITTSRHDASEWVSRFVGKQGPVRIGALAGVPPEWQAGSLEAIDALPRVTRRSEVAADASVCDGVPPRQEDPVDGDQAPAPEGPASRRRPRRRKSRRAGGRMMLASLSMVLIVEGVLVIRTGAMQSLKLDPIGDVRAAMTAPDAAPVVLAAASIIPRIVSMRRVAPAPAASDSTGFAPAASDSELASMEPPQAIGGGDDRPAHRYSLEVGTYVDAQEAFIERDRIHESTGMHAWVVVAPPGSSEMNRVLLGVYRTEPRAQGAANMLMDRGTVIEAAVVPLPRRGERQ